jgi:tetratricopeptide (TPR) repeat protein
MKSKYFIGIFILFLLVGRPVSVSSQNAIDSLKQLLQTDLHDTLKVKLYAQLSNIYLQANHDSAKILAQQGLYLAKKNNFENGIGDMNIALGHFEVIQNNLFQALENYLKAAAAFQNSNNKGSLTIAFLLLGNVSFTLGNYPNALDYYQKGLVIADSMNLVEFLPDFYNNIGELNMRLRDYNSAITNLDKGLIIRQDANDAEGAALILVNLGRGYAMIEEYDKALNYLKEAHLYYGKNSHNEGLFNVYDVYASMEQKKGNYIKAIEYYKEGHSYLLKIGSEYLGPLSIYNADFHSNIGFCYLQNNNYALAEQNLLKGYKIAEETGQIEYLKTTSEYLGKLYEASNKPVKALKFNKFFKLYSDSISKDENIKKITQLEMQFDFDKQLKQKEMERERLESKQRQKELIYIMISSGIFLALVILFLLFRLQKYKVKKISLERENLLVDLDYKNKELTTNVMYLLKKNEFIISISDKLKKSRYDFKPENRKIIDDLIRELEHSTSDNVWKDFEIRFQEVHADFYQKLTSQYPDLSPNELKLCAFLRLNMSTKEISTITFQSPKSISMARFRLRKKMGIGSYDNLISYLGKL